MKASPIAPFVLVAMLGACAETGADAEPILDGPPALTFQSDLDACRDLARNQPQFERQTMSQAAIGAGIGGVLSDSGEAFGGAMIGALFGAANGLSEANDAREGIVKNCLRGRGHRVVG